MRMKTVLEGIAAAACMLAGVGFAADYPSKPLTLVVPFAAGGQIDVVTRLIAPRASLAFGQAMIVENRGGAATMIGTRYVAQAAPDGYTVLLNSPTIVLNALAYRAPGYRMSDFIPVAPIVATSFIVSAHSAVPVHNLSEFISYAKANPGKLNAASLGDSSVTTMSLERFLRASGISVVKINYAGSGPALQALRSGFVQLFMDGAATTLPLAKSPEIRMLATTGDKRLAVAPDLPTFKELGFPSMVNAGGWTAAFVRAGTPDASVQALRNAFQKSLSDPDVQKPILGMGLELWEKPEIFPASLAAEVRLWGDDVKAAGLSLDGP